MVTLDVCDYSGNIICSLYDSSSSVSGQAHDIVPVTQRNGWKELNFVIPGVMEVAEGPQQRNFRLDYLKPEYKLRLYAVDDNGQGLLDPHYDASTQKLVRDKVDWYTISQPNISHENFTVQVSVKANHVSQILKTKNLGLVFSDKEGNNVGTAEELLGTVLEGSGWAVGHVDQFLEKDERTVKHRTLVAQERTGAFALITKIADLFEAKAIFHGDTNTVDLVPMNPFSEPVGGGMPEINEKNSDGVFELHYGKNVKSVSKSQNTENMVTRLYAYGSYGDMATGYCGIDELTHTEWIYTCDVNDGQECAFIYQNSKGIDVTAYFTAHPAIHGTVVFSNFDPASMMYVWDGTYAHKVYYAPKTASQSPLNLSEKKEVQNMFSSMMDFSYYDEVGLFNDAMLQVVAQYQREAPAYLDNVSRASAAMSEKLNELSQIVGSVDFVKLSNPTFTNDNGNTRINFTGHVYTTEYLKKQKDWFTWRAATSIKKDGTAMNSGASIVYIIRDVADLQTLTFEKYYIKSGSREEDSIVLWDTYKPGYFEGARVYVMKSNSARGYLSAAEDAVLSLEESLDEGNKDITVIHPTYFSMTEPSREDIGESDQLAYSENPSYGWWWKYGQITDNVYTPLRELYIAYAPRQHELSQWTRVYYGDTTPSVMPGYYHYNWRDKLLRYCPPGSMQWHEFNEGRELEISSRCDRVISAALRRQSYYDGFYNTYTYDVTAELPIGNYAVDTDYGIFWLFSTDKVMPVGSQLIHDSTHKQITEHVDGDEDKVLEVKHFQMDSVYYHPENITPRVAISSNTSIDTANGNEIEATGMYTSKNIRIYPMLKYDTSLLTGGTACFYNEKGHYLGFATIEANDPDHSFTTHENARFVRIVTSVNIADSAWNVHAHNYLNIISAEEDTYNIISLADFVGSGVKKGLLTQLKLFADYADEAYDVYKDALDRAQSASKDRQTLMTNALGPMYREGWWQKETYVDGDEQKLYDDAMETLKHISHPTDTYNISFVDYRKAEMDSSNGVLPQFQHVTIRSAAHLIDDDTGISQWAYIDTYKPCLDQPWKTQIQINTNLTTMSQHTFADVMAHIAEVANNIGGNETLYARAAVVGRYNRILAENIEGQFDLDRIKLSNATSNVYQDDRGNWIFETADGSSAMKLTGAGFCLASTKNEDGDWNWRTFGTGEGFSADLITSGHIKANLIEAGTITTEMIAAPVGSELNLVGNQSIKIVADTAIYETDYSNGDNLLRGASSDSMFATTTFLLNNIDLTDSEMASDMITFRVFMNNSLIYPMPDPIPTAKAMLRVYVGDAFTDYYGNEIASGTEGWSTVTAVVPSNAVKLGAYLYGDTSCLVQYHSPKVEFGEIPTEFSKCRDDLEDNVRSLERAVLDVNPRYISQKVTSAQNYRQGNLYAESYDNPTATPATVVCTKNIYHGITLASVSTAGTTVTLPLTLIKTSGDYTVSFMITCNRSANIDVSMSGSLQHVSTHIIPYENMKVIAPFESVTMPATPPMSLSIQITPASNSAQVTISALMVQTGLVATEWVASSLPDPMIGANILQNGGFSSYSSTGVVGHDQKWDPFYANAYVSNSTMNPGRFAEIYNEGTETEYTILRVDPSCNTLAVLVSDTTQPYGVEHVGAAVVAGEYYTFSCYAATLNNTQCSVTISNAEPFETTIPVAITNEPLDTIESYQYITIPFKATSDTVEVRFQATATNENGKIFVYHCKLEKGINATIYSEPIVNALYESYNQTTEELANVVQRVTSAEIQLQPDVITQTVMSQQVFNDRLDAVESSAVQQTKQDLQVTIQTVTDLAPATSWFHFNTVQGVPTLTLGTTINEFSTELTNRQLAFKQGGVAVAYINDEKLFIDQGEFIHGFRIGELNAIIDASNGSVNWVWDT